ncbi:MAG: GyrI-like domain-containing protein, partial [Acidobacteriaceae bacterium]
VTSADKIPDGMVARTVRAGKYSVVASETGPPQEVIPALWQRIAQMTPRQLGGARAYQTDFETYGAIVDWGNMQTTAHLGLK